jgi:hypothetical protein
MAKHLIHIGYPKAGSTFLQAWFAQHPELCYAPGGLGGFYNIYEICRPSDWACKYFVTSFEGIATPHKSAGDFRLDTGLQDFGPEPIKDDQKNVCSVLSSLYPGSRILIVTRGFKGIILSGYSQYVRTGGVMHLDQMCKSLAHCLQIDDYHYYDFDYLIKLYSDAFGEENLIVLPYELLRDNQPAFLSALEEKLEVKHVEPEFGRLNQSLSPEELYWYPVISRKVSAVVSRLGEARFQRLYRWYIGKTMENKLRRAIRILQRFNPDRQITGADLPDEILQHCKGKAARLENDPLYAPYNVEYLWNLQEASREDSSTSHHGKTK